MSTEPSRAVKLFGTEATEPKSKLLTAGALSLELANGSIRYLKLAGVEILRAVAFVVRDENWGTFVPEIRDLQVKQESSGFSVSYQAHCGDAKRKLSYDALIEGDSAGVRFQASAHIQSDFLTNRTGFMVLHPLAGVAGCPVEVEHVDGSIVKAEFPKIIDPMQPFFAVRSLKHEVMSGVWATCRMEGDTFEMEDHRNWTDASFKTYVRPLALPWPYTLAAGSEVTQSVSLTIDGPLPPHMDAGPSGSVSVRVGAATGGVMPKIGLGVPAEEAQASVEVAEQIKRAGVRLLLCQLDPRHGHGLEELSRYRELAELTGAELVLEIVLPCMEPPQIELARIADQVNSIKLKLGGVSVSPAADLKAVLPGSPTPKIPPLAEIYAAAADAFPDVKLGGGSFAFFTELNRKRPPSEWLDFVTHTTCPIVHAADDRSVMETLEALPYLVQSARLFLHGTPHWVGPSSIGSRDNPYGKATTPNPSNQRVCLAKMDPRQRGLFNAAWTLGYVAKLALGGVETVSLGAPIGPFGMIYRKTDYPQPYFDDLERSAVYPVFHIIAGLARAAGKEIVSCAVSNAAQLASLAYRSGEELTVWLANTSGEELSVTLDGLPDSFATVQSLDENTFVSATMESWASSTTGPKRQPISPLRLSAYAVARVDLAAN
jgi:D-apionolactonase